MTMTESPFAHYPRGDIMGVCRAWLDEHDRVFTVQAKANDEIELSIFDVIGGGFFGGGITARGVKYQLDQQRNAKTIKVLINSPGGDVAEGMAIYNLLRAHKAEVRTEVVGLAASAASWVAQAGDTRIMHQPSMLMIHPAWSVTRGSQVDHAKTAELLSKLDGEQVALFAKRTGLGADELAKMVADETWMGAQESLDRGFADELATDEADDAAPDSERAALRAEHEDVEAGAVPYRAYPAKQDSSWDGSAAEGRIRKWASSDGSGSADKMSWSKYRNGFAWYDAANPNEFGSYKLPHHDVVGGNLVTSRAGTIAAGGVVSGARGGTSIPASDLPAVKAHLEKHYRQFNMTAPWRKSKSELDGELSAELTDAEIEEQLLARKQKSPLGRAVGVAPPPNGGFRVT